MTNVQIYYHSNLKFLHSVSSIHLLAFDILMILWSFSFFKQTNRNIFEYVGEEFFTSCNIFIKYDCESSISIILFTPTWHFSQRWTWR